MRESLPDVAVDREKACSCKLLALNGNEPEIEPVAVGLTALGGAEELALTVLNDDQSALDQ